jgi:hypothetical protein
MCRKFSREVDVREIKWSIGGIAQFIAVCSSSILAETLDCAISFLSPLRGKRRVLERRKPLLTDQLQPSTNSDKLSDSGLQRMGRCPAYSRPWGSRLLPCTRTQRATPCGMPTPYGWAVSGAWRAPPPSCWHRPRPCRRASARCLRVWPMAMPQRQA